MAQTWAEIEGLELTPPEQALVAACRAGTDCVLGDGTRPEGPDPARNVRAALLRFLILGGDQGCRVHARGVRLAGAYVSEALDLAFARAQGQTVLRYCRFAAAPNLQNARLQLLSLDGSATPGLFAEGAQVTGGVFLRAGFEAQGEVRLSSATIGGQLACDGGRFAVVRDAKEKPVGNALNAQGAQVMGSVFLNGTFTAEGEVSLSSATIGGQLSCKGGRFAVVRDAKGKPVGKALNAQGAQVTGSVFLNGTFTAEGEVSLSSATIGAQLACTGGRFAAARDAEGNPVGDALVGQRMRVAGGFFFRKVTVESGRVNLASAEVGDLVDDPESWRGDWPLYLDGFTYQRISGAFTDSRQRLDWLAKGTVWKGEFHPQPYAQLAKVLREMGHDRAAREVLVTQERLIACHARARLRAQPLAERDGLDRALGVHTVRPRAAGLAVWDWLKWSVVGYGHQPFRSIVWLLGLWGIAVILAQIVWASGAMVPASDVILTSDGWLAVAGQVDAAAVWAEGAGRDWETFNAAAWAFDVVVPILDLGQVAAWAPSTSRGIAGVTLWWGRWVLTIAGWVVVALAAAAVTGIIRRE